VIYQIYPRSFRDASGDGMGDLAGIIQGLPALARLGVDAIWLSPFMTSPQRDAGYDVADYRDVDPLFGTLEDYDRMVATAHSLGLRVIADLVPNHTSSDHAWFQAALAAAPGSPERARYIFRDGRGENGDLPPNNWESVFGGSTWTRTSNPDGTPGQWYLHVFDPSQPDLDWTNPEVRDEFLDILRFWLDRGTDGFRVDVAHGLIKEDGLPDFVPAAGADSMGGGDQDPPFFGQDGVHEIYREWHQVMQEYPDERVLCAEAWVSPLSKMARWVRPDEMQQAFNFSYLGSDWDATALRRVIDESLVEFGKVGAPSTWVLSNHDVVRHTTRLSLGQESPQGDGVGPLTPGLPAAAPALRRARAATALMLALPGGAYIYQGEELGLPEATDLPDDARQDPTWFRTNGERYGRDGCRVPLPWSSGGETFGFSSGGQSWLPQPSDWGALSREAQEGVPGSTLELYTSLLRLRREHALAHTDLVWLEDLESGLIGFRVGDVTVVANTSGGALPMPATGEVLVASDASFDAEAAVLPGDTTVWMRAENNTTL
jgi:alpha-glucosidase